MLVGLDKQDRLFFRLPVALPVDILFLPDGVLPGEEARRTIRAQTENLSGGGVQIRTSEPPVELIGDLLSGRVGVAVSLALPDGPARALARVAWLEGVGQEKGEIRMGLQFQEITGVDRDRVISYVVGAFLP